MKIWLNKKGSIDYATTFAVKPRDWRGRVENILTSVGTSPRDLQRTLDALEELVGEVEVFSQSGQPSMEGHL